MLTRLDRDILKAIKEPGDLSIPEAVLEVIKACQPDQVFDWDDLVRWAKEAGFTREIQ